MSESMWYMAYESDTSEADGSPTNIKFIYTKEGYVEDKADIPAKYQHAVALLDALDLVPEDDGDTWAQIAGVGEKWVYCHTRETDYYILKSFLEAQDGTS